MNDSFEFEISPIPFFKTPWLSLNSIYHLGFSLITSLASLIINSLYLFALAFAYPILLIRNLKEWRSESLSKDNSEARLLSILDLQNCSGFLEQIKNIIKNIWLRKGVNFIADVKHGLQGFISEIRKFSTWDAHSYFSLLMSGGNHAHRFLSLVGRCFSLYKNFHRESHPLMKSWQNFKEKNVSPSDGKYHFTPKVFRRLVSLIISFSILTAQLSFDWSKLPKVALINVTKVSAARGSYKNVFAKISYSLYMAVQFFTFSKGIITFYTEAINIQNSLRTLWKNFRDHRYYINPSSELLMPSSTSPITSTPRRLKRGDESAEDAKENRRTITLASSASFQPSERRNSEASIRQHLERIQNYKNIYRNELGNLLISFGGLCAAYNDIWGGLNGSSTYKPDNGDAVIPSWLYQNCLTNQVKSYFTTTHRLIDTTQATTIPSPAL